MLVAVGETALSQAASVSPNATIASQALRSNRINILVDARIVLSMLCATTPSWSWTLTTISVNRQRDLRDVLWLAASGIQWLRSAA
jgi:hypothetical protein